jgi:glycosyltransferase involved in cell wall biosynthesis
MAEAARLALVALECGAMRICIIGGIYGKGGRRTSYIKATPETNLEAGLSAAGHEVTTLSHYDDVSFDEFDVVHVHHLGYGAARLACDPSGRPFVFTPHDASFMNGVHPGMLRHSAMRYVMSRADGIVSLSAMEAEFQRNNYPTAGAKIHVIPNGIVADTFRPVPRNPKGRLWKLLFVGQLIRLKGCDLLLKAVARLPHRVQLSLAYQSDALKLDLELLARKLGIGDRVKFLGRLDPAELALLYQSSDLLVLPSATEALPSVITEAMLSGLPFVASAVGGIPEQAAGFGRLLETRTPEALAEAIADVLDHYSVHSKRSEEMSAHARSVYSIDAMVNKHIKLYQALVEHGTVRRNAGKVLDSFVRAAVRYRGQGNTQSELGSATAITNRT